MRAQILVSSCLVFWFSAILWSGRELRSPLAITPAAISGHITIDEVIGKKRQSDPIAKLKLYLVRVEDSGPLVDLQMSCRHAAADPNTDPLRAYRTCDQSLRQAVEVVPSLRCIATTETDRNGQYEFAAVPVAGRYRVVGVQAVAGAEPVLVVGVTATLKAGERVTLNLSANYPWTRDAPAESPNAK